MKKGNGKTVKVWFGRLVGQTEKAIGPVSGGGLEKSRTLKGLCGKLGISYNTAKVKQDSSGEVTVWVKSDSSVWHVWVEMIGR